MTVPTPREIQKRLLVRTAELAPGWEAPWGLENVQGELDHSGAPRLPSSVASCTPAPPKAIYWEDSKSGKESAFTTIEKPHWPHPICPKPAPTVSACEGTSHLWTFPKPSHLLVLKHNANQEKRGPSAQDKPSTGSEGRDQ